MRICTIEVVWEANLKMGAALYLFDLLVSCGSSKWFEVHSCACCLDSILLILPISEANTIGQINVFHKSCADCSMICALESFSQACSNVYWHLAIQSCYLIEHFIVA